MYDSPSTLELIGCMAGLVVCGVCIGLLIALFLW